MDIILSGAILLGIAVTVLCVGLHKSGASEANDEYDRYLDEYNDHLYYDRTSIRYKRGIWRNKKERKDI